MFEQVAVNGKDLECVKSAKASQSYYNKRFIME